MVSSTGADVDALIFHLRLPFLLAMRSKSTATGIASTLTGGILMLRFDARLLTQMESCHRNALLIVVLSELRGENQTGAASGSSCSSLAAYLLDVEVRYTQTNRRAE